MTKQIFFKPTAGVNVPLPMELRINERKHGPASCVAPEGEVFEESTWWLRREREGDGTISAPPTAAQASKEAPRASKGSDQ
jgi:hypothetical protein